MRVTFIFAFIGLLAAAAGDIYSDIQSAKEPDSDGGVSITAGEVANIVVTALLGVVPAVVDGVMDIVEGDGISVSGPYNAGDSARAAASKVRGVKRERTSKVKGRKVKG